jgi:glycerophosphoryl diester phosphodiesterase
METMKTPLPKPLIVAHRGYSARYPENTLAAFEAAKQAGAHMVELDVSLTKDRRLVVMHDDTVDRTTDGSGVVRQMTLEQLRRLDAGSWFDPRFAAERPPTLAQVLDLARGHLAVNVEIKPEAVEAPGPADAVERQIVNLVRDMGMPDEVLISSFNWSVLARIRQMAPEIAVGLLSWDPVDRRLREWWPRIDGFAWHPAYRVVTPSQVEILHALGARVFPFAVGGKIDVSGLLAMGVDGLILDDPREMR